MEFEIIKYDLLYIIFVVAIVIFLILGYKKKIRIGKAMRLQIDKKIEFAKIIGLSFALTIFYIALLQPRMLKERVPISKEGLDIYILVDTSKSMLAKDIQPNRLIRAKESISKLIDTLQGDRIGFIPFSSDAYIQMPLTDDYSMSKMFLEVIDTDMIYGGGTDIVSALKLAEKSFHNSAQGDKVIIIFSDGEVHDEAAIKKAKMLENVKVFSVGLGTETGSVIPEYDRSGKQIGHKKDRQGKTIISKLNPSTLKTISENSGGKFYHSSIGGEEVDKLLGNISRLKTSEYKEEEVKIYREYYQIFLGLGLIIFILVYFLQGWRRKK